MSDAPIETPVRDPDVLDALTAETPCPRLVLHEGLNKEAFERMGHSPGLEHVQVLEIDCAHDNESVTALLAQPALTNVHAVVTRGCDWKTYSKHESPYGWAKHALDPALEALSYRSPITRVEFLGALPDYNVSHQYGSLDIVLYSNWMQGLEQLVFDTPQLTDGIVEGLAGHGAVLRSLRTLSLRSSSLTDAGATTIARVGKSPALDSLDVQGRFISPDGWGALSRCTSIREDDRARFAMQADAAARSWDEVFDDARALLERPLGAAEFDLVVDRLSTLKRGSGHRYKTEVLPLLTSTDRALWPELVEIAFSDRQDIERMDAIHKLIPFVDFHVRTRDANSFGAAQWYDLGCAASLSGVRRISSYNHVFDQDNAEALLRSRRLTNLRSLQIVNEDESDADAYVTLLSSPQLAGLEHLELYLIYTPGEPLAQAILNGGVCQTLKALKFVASGEDEWRPLLKPLECFTEEDVHLPDFWRG